VLFVSHNMAAVRNLCTRGMLFDQGRLKFTGPIDDTVNKYLNELDEKETKINLASRKDREGDGSIRAIGIQLRNLENENGLPATGAGIEFIVEYEDQQQIQISKLFAAITVRDGFGTNLFTCSTGMKKTEFFNVAAHGYAICRVEYLPLITGHYSLNIKLSNGNSVADYITNATGFEVVDSGASGFVNYASPSWGHVVVPHEWRLERCE
jgi:lipopolysaccharide transport system ATP-binding protein